MQGIETKEQKERRAFRERHLPYVRVFFREPEKKQPILEKPKKRVPGLAEIEFWAQCE